MYHIKEDSRIQKSATLIRDGLVKCLKSKPISEISVSEIANASKVSRATFYRIFDSPIDALKYICDTLAQEVVNEHTKHHSGSREEFVLNTLRMWMQRSDFLEAVMRSRRPDILQDAFARFSERYYSDMERKFAKEEIDYVNAFFAATMCSILYVWAVRGKKETPEQLLEVFKKLSLC